MLDHLEITVTNAARAERFYGAALAPLGYELHVSGPSSGFGTQADALDFWIKAGAAATPPPHFAFQCRSRAIVEAAFTAALAAGGDDNGKPRLLAHIHPSYYAGFVRDPDGHNVEFVCHRPQQ